MAITKDEAVRIARGYGMSLTDAETLSRMADTVEEAQHLAVQIAGTPGERADEADKAARKARDVEASAEYARFAEYQAERPKTPLPAWKTVEADLRPGMSDAERARLIGEADAANARGAAQVRSDAAQAKSSDFYGWKETLKAPAQ